MTVRERGDSFQADFMYKGRRYRETFDTQAEAVTWEKDARHALNMGRSIPDVKNKRTATGAKLNTLSSVLEHTKRTHWAHMRAGDILTFNAGAVVDILGPSRSVSEITSADLAEAYAELVDAGNSPATANRKMAGISKLLTVAVDAGVIARKPKVPKQKESEGRIRYLTLDEEAHIIGLFHSWGQHWLAHFTIVAIDTGMRLSELLRIEWRDVSPDGKMLHIWETKAKLNRSVPITKRTGESLKWLRENFGESKGPFRHLSENGSIRTLWDRMREAASYHDVTIHVCRHTCASRLCQTPGINLQFVQKWLGHKSITTTMRYAHLAPTSLEHCKAALEGYYEIKEPERGTTVVA